MESDAWRIELFGGLRARRGDETVARFKSQKIAGLLAYLAYHLDQAHPREVLIDMFWGDSELDAGRASLSTALSSLRYQFEPPGTPPNSVVRADRFAVGLNAATVVTDVQEFDSAVRRARRSGDAPSRRAALETAAEIYNACLLPGFYEEWIPPEQDRLADAFQEVAASLIELFERQGDTPFALQMAQRAVSADPLREEAHRHVIRLLAASGRPADALRQYRQLERVLDDELGEEPSAPVRALAREIERQSGFAAPPELSPSPAPIARPHRIAGRPVTLTFLLVNADIPADLERGADAAVVYREVVLARFAAFDGQIVEESGTAYTVAFQTAGRAVECAASCGKELVARAWPETADRIVPRMAVLTGDAEPEGGDLRTATVGNASRLFAAARRGQILVASSTAGLVRKGPAASIPLIDIGTYRLSADHPAERLFQLAVPELTEAVGGDASAQAGLACRLPARVTRFFGREKELAVIADRVSSGDARLMAITGTAGAGKTRLALEAAERLVETFHGAVWFVPLADVRDAAMVPETILRALRTPQQPGTHALERLAETLAGRRSLLVLDNAEHLVDAVAEAIEALLTRVSELSVLVTSRRLLRIAGEREFPLTPLPTPNGGESAAEVSLFDSVRLFVDRAQAVMPHFQVTENNAPAVAELCQRLEGIPLAIELAASRALVMTPVRMLSQLEERFEFLVSRGRGADARHRTLRTAVEWSYQLLSPELQRFFARLSIFRGGWTVEAAEAVCEDPLALDRLEQLRECSLVVADAANDLPAMRYRMLDTLRELGTSYLAIEQQAAIRRLHAIYYRDFAQEFGPGAELAANWARLDLLEGELGNLRAALDWTEEVLERVSVARDILKGTFAMWQLRGYLAEGASRIVKTLAAPVPFDPEQDRAAFLLRLSMFYWYQGDYEAARNVTEEGLAIALAADDMVHVFTAHHVLGNILRAQGQLAAARSQFETSLSMRRAIGDDADVAATLVALGAVYELQGEYGPARSAFEEGLSLWRGLDNAGRISVTLNNIGHLDYMEGDLDAALAHIHEALSIAVSLGSKLQIPEHLENLGRIAAARGDSDRALRLFGAGSALREALGIPVPPVDAQSYAADIATVRSAASAAEQAAWEAGRAMSLEESTAFALST